MLNDILEESAGIFLTEKDVAKEEAVSLFSKSSPPQETIFLSNIDQSVVFPVETLYFFEVPPSKRRSSLDVAERVKEAVEVLLGPYYILAGRLNFNQETKRVELFYNNAGALFVSASSTLALKDLGNLSQPNPTFHHFIHRPGLHKSLLDTAIFTIQVTRFSCGGFSIGVMVNHAILDGKSASDMLHHLASICRGDNLKITSIYTDRTRIRARNPLQISYPNNEKLDLRKTNTPTNIPAEKKYVHKTFSFSAEMLNALKDKAMTKCSTFEAIVAHLWRTRTKVVFREDLGYEDSTVLFAVDIRSKVSPPFPNDFAGNAVISTFAKARVGDLIEQPLFFGVKKIQEARERVTRDYVQSVVDCLEVYRGIPATCDGRFYVSAWWKLAFNELDFGFGKPVFGSPIASENNEFVLLLPDNGKNGGNGDGINVWIGLEKESMLKFMSFVFEF